MSDAVQVEEGRAPWLPASNAVPGEVFDFFNVPRAGLLHQNGLTYYFECIIGDGQPVGIWAYSHVSDDEVTALLKARGPEDFDAITPRLIEGRWLTNAIAIDDVIVDAAVLDAHDEGVVGLAERIVARWERQQVARAEATRLVDSLPT